MKTSVFRSVSLLALASCAFSAQAALFDFETTGATSSALEHPGALTSLSLSASGLGLTLYRPSGLGFDVLEVSSYLGRFPASFGDRALDPFAFVDSTDGLVGDFSGLVSGVSLDFGDLGGDLDILTLNVYSGLGGTGTLLGTTTVEYGGRVPTIATLSVVAPGIRSFTLNGDTSRSFPLSVFIDNVSATPQSISSVPGPAAALPFALMALRRRKKA